MACTHPDCTAGLCCYPGQRVMGCHGRMPDPLLAGDERWFESAADLMAEPDPGETPFLVQELIVDGSVAQLVGPPKKGKTYVLLDVAIAIATGTKALGRFPVPDRGPVLIVLEESGRKALHRRLDWLTRGRAIRPEDLTEFHFSANRRVKLDDEEWRKPAPRCLPKPNPGGSSRSIPTPDSKAPPTRTARRNPAPCSISSGNSATSAAAPCSTTPTPAMREPGSAAPRTSRATTKRNSPS